MFPIKVITGLRFLAQDRSGTCGKTKGNDEIHVLQTDKVRNALINPSPHRNTFDSFANRAGPDQADQGLLRLLMVI